VTKKISISLSDHTFNTYLNETHKNLSEYIEMLIQVGAEELLNRNKSEFTKSEKLKLINELQKLEQENNKLKAQIGQLKSTKNEIVINLEKEGFE
tara:strand:- start:775 stop:1059 length:285 start_codon:yes stop_codon:yes gene_type:complete